MHEELVETPCGPVWLPAREGGIRYGAHLYLSPVMAQQATPQSAPNDDREAPKRERPHPVLVKVHQPEPEPVELDPLTYAQIVRDQEADEWNAFRAREHAECGEYNRARGWASLLLDKDDRLALLNEITRRQRTSVRKAA
jgi:hypothetical protein